jgi:hypothetical protein
MATGQLSKAEQEIAVAEGLAVGCLALGVAAVTANKQALESAFRHAWRGWSETYRFPAVHATVPRNDIRQILVKSTRRRSPVRADWLCDKELEPGLVFDWGLEDTAEAIEESCGVPFASWIELARAFTGNFKALQVTWAAE